MLLRPLTVLAVFALLIGAAIGGPRKPTDAPVTVSKPVAAPAHADKPYTPGFTLPSSGYLQLPEEYSHEPTERMQQLLNESADLRQAREQFHQFWMNNQPATLAYERPVFKSYAVGDLVVPAPRAGSIGIEPPVSSRTSAADLIRKIITCVEPKSWSAANGAGTIEFFPLGLTLVVNQTPAVHEALDKFLTATRRRPATEVAISFKLITVSDAGLRKCSMDGSADPSGHVPCETAAKKCVPCLSQAEVKKLLETLQEDRATNVCQAPKITTPSGETGLINVDLSESFITSVTVNHVGGNVLVTPKSETVNLGLELRAEPTVSSDGKLITLDVRACQRELAVLPVPTTPVSTKVRPVAGTGNEAVPFTQLVQSPTVITRKVAETVCVPDGGTVLLYGGKAVIERTVRKDIDPRAKTASEEKSVTTNHLLVLVTAHVVKPVAACVQCASVEPANPRLSSLMVEYSTACKAGKVDDARRLAIECLAIDPTCFGRK
jgi:hypothetical protein